MNLKTRKIIAREFLILFVVIGLGGIGFLCTYPYNFYKKHEIINLTDSISKNQKISDSISEELGYYGWHVPIYDQLSDTSSLLPPPPIIGTSSAGLPIFQKIPAEKVFDNLIKVGFSATDLGGSKDNFIQKISNPTTAKKFYTDLSNQGFTERQLGTMDEFVKAMGAKSAYWQKRISLENQDNILRMQAGKLYSQKGNIEQKILSFKDQVRFGFLTIGLFLILLFGFRYVYYALRWSIKTLKTQ